MTTVNRLAGVPYPPRSHAAYALGALMVVTFFSLLDRNIPSLLISPLKAEFGIGDTQLSLLQGPAFALVYGIMGLPFGYLVDRTKRRNLIIVGLVIWSATTIASGFATSFTFLVIMRMGVGIGEACLAPAAYSLIADYFEPRVRGRALAVYFTALSAGAGGSLLLGGLLLDILPAALHLPLLPPLEPWRALFLFAGLPGLLLVLPMLAVKEPARQPQPGEDRGMIAKAPRLRDFGAHFWAERRAFVPLYLCYVLVAFVSFSAAPWLPAFYERSHGLAIAKAGIMLGIVQIAGYVIGNLAGGWLSDRWIALGKDAARFRVVILGAAIMFFAGLMWPTLDNLIASVAFVGLFLLGCGMASSSAPATIQDVTPNRMRGMAISVYVFLAGMVGVGIGPMAVALFSDYWGGGEAQGLATALLVVPSLSALLCLLISLGGRRAYQRTYARIHTSAKASVAHSMVAV